MRNTGRNTTAIWLGVLFVFFNDPVQAASGSEALLAGAHIQWIDLAILVVFMAAILWIGSFLWRWVGSPEDFSLAGRSLPPFILAATMTAANLNLFGLISQNGTTYKHGISIIWQGWTGCMALALAGLFILPIFRRLQVATIPEFLERRYSRGTRGLLGFFSMFRLAFWLGIVLNASARAAEMIAGSAVTGSLNSLGVTLGLPEGSFIGGSYLFWVGIFSVLVITYTFLGGMWSVAILDTVNFVFIMGGLLIVMPLAMRMVGYFKGLSAALGQISPQHLDLMPLSGPYSWSFVLAIFFLGIQWASTDPGLVQKSFSSRDTRSLAKGLVLSGVITVPFCLLSFMPALAARVLFPNLAHPDYAYPALMLTLLPAGLMGLVCVGLMASQFSTVDASLTSAATIFTNDIYRNLFRPGASKKEVLLVIRAVTLVIGFMMIGFSFLVPFFENAVDAYLTVVSFVDMPLFVVAVITGLLWRRATSGGAIWGYLLGILGGAAVIFPFKYAAAFGIDPTGWLARNYMLAGTVASGLAALVVCWAVSLAGRPPDQEKVRSVWAVKLTSFKEPETGEVYHLWPSSGWGKFWIWTMFAGCGVFLAGVLMGASGAASAGWVAVAGMLVFFLGAWTRLYYE